MLSSSSPPSLLRTEMTLERILAQLEGEVDRPVVSESPIFPLSRCRSFHKGPLRTLPSFPFVTLNLMFWGNEGSSDCLFVGHTFTCQSALSHKGLSIKGGGRTFPKVCASAEFERNTNNSKLNLDLVKPIMV